MPGADLTHGYMISNAERASQLRGDTECVAMTVGANGLLGAATFCRGYDSDGRYTGIWSIYLGLGVGTSGAGAQYVSGYTGVAEVYCYGDPVSTAWGWLKRGVRGLFK